MPIIYNGGQTVLESSGIPLRQSLLSKNIYTSSYAGNHNYIDEYGDLNLGQSGAVHAVDVLGGALSGGLGIGGSSNFDIRGSLAGRALTAAGILKDSKLGVIGGQQLALALTNNAAFNIEKQALGALNIQDNVVSLLKTGKLAANRPDYSITVPSSTGGKILSYAEKILGFVVPHSYLQPQGSLFTSESGIVDNISRANSMLKNTGLGQIKGLATQISATLFGTGQGFDNPNTSAFRVGYAPGYKDHNNNQLFVPVSYAYMNDDGTIFNFVGSVTNGNLIPTISYNREKMLETYGFVDINKFPYTVNGINDEDNVNAFRTNFAWNTSNGDAVNKIPNWEPLEDNMTPLSNNSTKKQLLFKTQALFNDVGMKTLVSVKGDKGYKTQIQTAISFNGLISKGSGVITGSKFNPEGTFNFGSDQNAENTFCRVWTPYSRYDSVKKMVRHRGLNQQENSGNSFFTSGDKASSWRVNTEGSVLDKNSNGFVKISPYKNDKHETALGKQEHNPKKYMFSIENLAWSDSESWANLLPEEKGPGDLLTGTYGRIMWFPPYDINFTETSSLNLESTNFIGRGEPIYTYNNTERVGNLSFKIVVDHPSVMNAFAGDSLVENEFIDSFIAGCSDLSPNWLDKLTGSEQAELEVRAIDDVTQQTIATIKAPENFKIYFPNDVTKLQTIFDIDYELHNSGVPNNVTYQGEPQYKSASDKYPEAARTFYDGVSYGLNTQTVNILDKSYYGWTSVQYLADLAQHFNETCKTCTAIVSGSASAQVNTPHANKQLALDRATHVRDYLVNVVKLDGSRVTTGTSKPATSTTYNDKTNSWNEKVKADRYASVVFSSSQEKTDTSKDKNIKKKVNPNALSTKIKRRFYTESNFFDQLTEKDPFIFDKFRDKIKYFHPAFHSTTPEGLNSRLTFLLQCTRQGKTGLNGDPSNLAFGRQPVCILRVGDFYNTKIMMDNVSFSFEPLVWDLNPEGVGVQPMIANVNISFKFIGGSSLYGPINKLQNALSFNYFANSQVYDPRADYIAYKGADAKTKDSKYNLTLGLSAISKTYDKLTPTIDPSSSDDIDQIKTADNVNNKSNSTNTKTSNAPTATTINDIVSFEHTVNVETDKNFGDDMHGAASSYQIKPNFSDKVGDKLKTYSVPVMVKSVTMQTSYDKITKNLTTKLTANISNSDNNMAYKHFDARGAAGTTSVKDNTFDRFNDNVNQLKSTTPTNFTKVDSDKIISIDIKGTNYTYYESFFQWTD